MPKSQPDKHFIRNEKLQIEYVPRSSIKPNGYNPNRETEKMLKQLERSIIEDGFTIPILVNKDTGEIVDGEHRWIVAERLSMEQVPIVRVSMTREQMRIATLRYNRTRGNEVIELTANVMKELNDLNALGWAQEALSMDKEETQRLLNMAKAAETFAKDTFSKSWDPVKTSDLGEGVHLEKDDYNRSHTGKKTEEHQTEFRLVNMFYGQDAEIIKAFFHGKNSAAYILKHVQQDSPQPELVKKPQIGNKPGPKPKSKSVEKTVTQQVATN